MEEEELEEAVPVAEEPSLEGLDCSPAQVNLPLITPSDPERALKVEQLESMSAEDWRLKAPRMSLMAGRVTLQFLLAHILDVASL